MSQVVAIVGVSISALFLLNTRRIQMLASAEKVDGEVDSNNSIIRIEELWIYPIKSCKGFKINKAEIVKTGFKYDREFMLVNTSVEGNKFMSQRTHPKMALIGTQIDENQNILIVSASLRNDIHVTLSLDSISSNSTFTVDVWGDECQGVDMGDEVASWFCDALQTPSLRLVRMAPSFKRSTDPKYAPDGQTAFSDGYPFLLLSTESMTELNKRSINGAGSSTSLYTVENFRPNIVVRGCNRGFDEDKWIDIEFTTSGVHMKIVKPCSRCKVPSVNVNTGEMDPDNTISKLLKTFRTGELAGFKKAKWAKELFVGQNVDHAAKAGGYLTVGESLKSIFVNKFIILTLLYAIKPLMETLIKDQKSACDTLIELGKSYFTEPQTTLAQATYRKACVKLLDLKSQNRELYSQLETKRKFVETKKENVDRLYLFYENLKYKQSYLRKQIRICQDLTTPSLAVIQAEIGQEIVATTFISDEDLEARNQLGTQILDSEHKKRSEMQQQLTVLEQKLNGVLEKVDKKRKFLDELAVRVSVVKASTIDLQAQFTAVLEEK